MKNICSEDNLKEIHCFNSTCLARHDPLDVISRHVNFLIFPIFIPSLGFSSFDYCVSTSKEKKKTAAEAVHNGAVGLLA